MAVVHVITRDEINSEGDFWSNNPGDPSYAYRFLAEGDSWFTLGGIPTSNLLFSLKFKKDTIIVNCATPGDTLRNMAMIAANMGLRKMLSRRFGYQWDLILFSGGGNDLIDAATSIVKPGQGSDPKSYVEERELAGVLDAIENGYQAIVALRDAADSPARGVPILTHVYDYPTPRNSPSRFFHLGLKGPWLYQAMVQAKVPEELRKKVSDYLLDRLAQRIQSLAAKLPNFHVVPTLGTLKPAKADSETSSGDWLNEIHPNAKGYEKLAKKIGAAAQLLLRPAVT